MKKHKIFAVASLLIISASAVNAQFYNSVGVLSCDVSSGVGLFLVEKQTMSCVFTPPSGKEQKYTGKIEEYGVELGETKKGHLTWAIFSPKAADAGALAGSYTGVETDAALGVGAGANVLVGGGQNAFSLQPVAVQTEQGIALAAGVESIQLTAAN